MSHAAALSEKLLAAAYKHQASDIHFYPFQDHTHVYFRTQGKRVLYKTIQPEQYDLLLTYYKFTSGMDIGEIRKPQNGVINHDIKTKQYSLRLSTLPINHRESLAIRILPQEENLTLDQLFLFPSQKNTLKNWITNRAGLILLTGATGSGKTTTLYALLHAVLIESSFQAITLEDPIEKNMNNILQVQVNEKAGITYQVGLKAALRHDPDIIMIGEIRDQQTAQFAFEASLTGHLVLSTLHAKNALGTIHRLLDMGIQMSDLRQSLIGVASLQLLPIDLNSTGRRRAAIMECLDGYLLDQALRGQEVNVKNNYQSFQHLRKKAFAYGFITKETYDDS